MSFTYKVNVRAPEELWGRARRDPKFREIDLSEGGGIELVRPPHTRLVRRGRHWRPVVR